MRNWEELYQKIGPLRYQASTSDCVPTTIINGLAVLLGRHIHPKLHQLIWALAGDQDRHGGTGWVCCDTLSVLLSKWFQRAHEDGREKEPLPFSSQVIEGDLVNLKENGALMRCMKGGGVACLTTGKNADHYALLIGIEGDVFIGFDSWWEGKKTARRIEEFASYKGIINMKWTREELAQVLHNSGWVHLLGRL